MSSDISGNRIHETSDRDDESPTKNRTPGREKRRATGTGRTAGKTAEDIVEEGRKAQKKARNAAREKLRERRRNTQATIRNNIKTRSLGTATEAGTDDSHTSDPDPDPETSEEEQDQEHPPSPIAGPGWESRRAAEVSTASSFNLPSNQLCLATPSGTSKTNKTTETFKMANPTAASSNTFSSKHTASASTTMGPALDRQFFIDLLDDRLKTLAKTADLETVIQKCDQNAANTTRMGMRMDDLERRLNDRQLQSDARIKDIVRSVLKDGPPIEDDMSLEENSVWSGDARERRGSTNSNNNVDGRREEEEAFAKARRSIRVWPIPGNDASQMRANFTEFLRGALLIPQSGLNDIYITQISRCKPITNSPVHTEVSVTFDSVQTRDQIAALGTRLAAYVDRGRPTAGMRLDIPPTSCPPSKPSGKSVLKYAPLMGKRRKHISNSTTVT